MNDIVTNDELKYGEFSLHDDYLVGYEVCSEGREIRLHARSHPEDKVQTTTDVFLRGVEAYSFKDDAFGNVILDLEEVPARQIYEENAAVFRDGYSRAGWPGPWNVSSGEALDFLEQAQLRGFVLSSSYGMSGWILARELRAKVAKK